MDRATAIIIALIGSGAFSAIVSGIINIVNNRRGRLKQIEDSIESIDKKLLIAEKDSLRTQLLLLLADYPEEQAEIMTLAQRYFGDLKGDWYMTSMFSKWLVKNDIAKPEWFIKE